MSSGTPTDGVISCSSAHNNGPANAASLLQPMFSGAAALDWALAAAVALPLLATLLVLSCHWRADSAMPVYVVAARVLSTALLWIGVVGTLAHGVPRSVLLCITGAQLGAVGLVLSEAACWRAAYERTVWRSGLLPLLPTWLRELLTRTTWLEFCIAPGLIDDLVLWRCAGRGACTAWRYALALCRGLINPPHPAPTPSCIAKYSSRSSWV